ncbi:sensor histidine kinase [Noviherbaspirillum sp.]|uniref:sensor histidine kinase n=1 Tax=Noviherbaspirillum sp. TaxID=1926288 RepID=UPI002D2AB5B3|nr:ATP-binding protein [Noviherbaspirillum sp.]HZW22817.1 ATP-binding protein [Noviherbaspirillum sp.]
MDTRLAAAVVHDIKNALGVLEGTLAALAQAPSREQAETAQGMCSTLRDRLIGFLTLYKASSQGLVARIDAMNPEDFLNAVVRDNPTGRPELTVAVDARDMPVLGFFDENLVGLALAAALQNAARFARSRVELRCSMDDSGTLAFTVRDDGPGLGAQEDKPSTGLGTALCAAIAQAHRKGERCGMVSLKDHPQGGALFTLRLP